MNGEEFYQFLREFYHVENQHICDNRQFVRWVPQNDGTFNLKFRFPANDNQRYNLKYIPKTWFVEAKNAKNEGVEITRNWFNAHFDEDHFNDCRASMAIWLLENHV